MAKKAMTEGSRKVLETLQKAGVGVPFTTHEMMEICGFEKAGSVTGSVTGLVNKGYAERFSVTETDENGKEKVVKKFALTEAGAGFNPDADAEAVED